MLASVYKKSTYFIEHTMTMKGMKSGIHAYNLAPFTDPS